MLLQSEQSRRFTRETEPKHSNTVVQRENRTLKFFRLEIRYWTQNSITNATVLQAQHLATDAVLLLHRMEFVQSVTRCEAAAVFAHPAAPLLLSHCISSGESTPKAWKRHTPLSLLQDPDTAQIHDEEQKKKGVRERKSSSEEIHYTVFLI